MVQHRRHIVAAVSCHFPYRGARNPGLGEAPAEHGVPPRDPPHQPRRPFALNRPPGQYGAVEGDVATDQLLIQAEGQGPERPRFTAPGGENQIGGVDVGVHTSS